MDRENQLKFNSKVENEKNSNVDTKKSNELGEPKSTDQSNQKESNRSIPKKSLRSITKEIITSNQKMAKEIISSNNKKEGNRSIPKKSYRSLTKEIINSNKKRAKEIICSNQKQSIKSITKETISSNLKKSSVSNNPKKRDTSNQKKKKANNLKKSEKSSLKKWDTGSIIQSDANSLNKSDMSLLKKTDISVTNKTDKSFTKKTDRSKSRKTDKSKSKVTDRNKSKITDKSIFTNKKQNFSNKKRDMTATLSPKKRNSFIKKNNDKTRKNSEEKKPLQEKIRNMKNSYAKKSNLSTLKTEEDPKSKQDVNQYDTLPDLKTYKKNMKSKLIKVYEKNKSIDDAKHQKAEPSKMETQNQKVKTPKNDSLKRNGKTWFIDLDKEKKDNAENKVESKDKRRTPNTSIEKKLERYKKGSPPMRKNKESTEFGREKSFNRSANKRSKTPKRSKRNYPKNKDMNNKENSYNQRSSVLSNLALIAGTLKQKKPKEQKNRSKSAEKSSEFKMPGNYRVTRTHILREKLARNKMQTYDRMHSSSIEKSKNLEKPCDFRTDEKPWIRRRPYGLAWYGNLENNEQMESKNSSKKIQQSNEAKEKLDNEIAKQLDMEVQIYYRERQNLKVMNNNEINTLNKDKNEAQDQLLSMQFSLSKEYNTDQQDLNKFETKQKLEHEVIKNRSPNNIDSNANPNKKPVHNSKDEYKDTKNSRSDHMNLELYESNPRYKHNRKMVKEKPKERSKSPTDNFQYYDHQKDKPKTPRDDLRDFKKKPKLVVAPNRSASRGNGHSKAIYVRRSQTKPAKNCVICQRSLSENRNQKKPSINNKAEKRSKSYEKSK